MPKYKPESKGNLERRVKEFDSKIKDRTNHMNKVVKNDAKAIADLSKKIKPGGTIEGAKAIKESSQQADKEVKKEYGHQKKNVKDIVKKGGKLESEFKERGKYSKLNYAELTKASSSIKETQAAKKRLDKGRQVAQENIYNMDSLRDSVHRALQRTNRCFQELDYKIADTLISANSGINSKYWFQAHQVNHVAMQKERNKDKGNSSEVKVVPQENLDDKLCSRAEKKIRKANAVAEKEAKLKAGQPLQDGKQVQVTDETLKKLDRNYGRGPLGTEGQNNVYNQKKTYQNE